MRGTDEQRDTDLAPVIRDQFQHVGFLHAFAGGLDDDLGWTPVRQHADAVVVDCVQTDLIEQGLRLLWIVLYPGLCIFGPVERTFRKHRVGADIGQAVEHRLVDLVAVDGQRQRAPHPHIAQQRPRQTGSAAFRLGSSAKRDPCVRFHRMTFTG